MYKPGCEPLDQFIRRKSCAGRFTRCLGRGAALDCEAQAKDPRLGNLRTLVRRRAVVEWPVARRPGRGPGYPGCALSRRPAWVARPCANLGNRQQAAPLPSMAAIPPRAGMMLHCGK